MKLADMIASIDYADDMPQAKPASSAVLVDTLRTIFAARSVAHNFTHGQILRHKYPDMANVKDADRPIIFLGYKTTPVKELPPRHAVDIQDCLLGALAGSGDQMAWMIYPADAAAYEPHPDFAVQ